MCGNNNNGFLILIIILILLFILLQGDNTENTVKVTRPTNLFQGLI